LGAVFFARSLRARSVRFGPHRFLFSHRFVTKP